jgi:hypothetical protein
MQRMRIGGYGLLNESIEQQATLAGGEPVEPKMYSSR